jgi:hypothetical protein
MNTENIQGGYVKCAETGSIYVQVPDNSQWGFTIYSDNQSWPGGFGIMTEWTLVPDNEVPKEVKEVLGDWRDYLDEQSRS